MTAWHPMEPSSSTAACAIPAALFVISPGMRTRLDDALLTRELAGYREWREQTPFRLVPGVW